MTILILFALPLDCVSARPITLPPAFHHTVCTLHIVFKSFFLVCLLRGVFFVFSVSLEVSGCVWHSALHLCTHTQRHCFCCVRSLMLLENVAFSQVTCIAQRKRNEKIVSIYSEYDTRAQSLAISNQVHARDV